MKRRPFLDSVTLLFLAVTVLLTLAVNCNNRFWWQIPIASAAFWWIPLLLTALVLQLIRTVRRDAPVLLTLCGFICCATAIDGVVQPILSLYRPLPTHLRDLSKEEKLRFAYLDGALCDAPQLQRLVSALHADVVLVTVKNKDSVALSSFAHNRFYPLEGGGVVVASRLSFDGEMVADFGDEALPALLVKLRTSQDTTLSISYLELLRAVDPYAFHVNRTTLRRVATQFRNMDEAGLLVTKLRTPIFSKFYGLLVNYGNVRNVWRDTPALQSIARAWFEIPFADTQFLVNLGISGVTPEHILDEDKKVVGTAYSFSTRAFTS